MGVQRLFGIRQIVVGAAGICGGFVGMADMIIVRIVRDQLQE